MMTTGRVGFYVPNERDGKRNKYELKCICGENVPASIQYKPSRDGCIGHFTPQNDPISRVYSFSAIKQAIKPILDPDAGERLRQWEGEVGAERAKLIRDESKAAGSMLHRMLENWVQKKPLGAYDLNMSGYRQALQKDILPYLSQSETPIAIADNDGGLTIASEIFVADFDRQFLGRLDLAAEISINPFEGRRVLLELKGSRKEKKIEYMRDTVVQGVAYLTTYNLIASAFPGRALPLDGLTIAYAYRSGRGQFIPLFGEDLQEYVEEWQRWLACFQNIVEVSDVTRSA